MPVLASRLASRSSDRLVRRQRERALGEAALQLLRGAVTRVGALALVEARTDVAGKVAVALGHGVEVDGQLRLRLAAATSATAVVVIALSGDHGERCRRR